MEAESLFSLAPSCALCYVCLSMKLRIPSLTMGSNPLNETLNPKALGLEEENFQKPVLISGEAVCDEYKIDVRLQIETDGDFVCFRCAGEFVRHFSLDTRLLVMLRAPEDGEEEETEGLLFVSGNVTEVDLSQEIIESILLDIPLQILCKSECKGFCPYCYHDFNQGPCEHSDEVNQDDQ
jgi:uncharacterized metal-binding protein YceD (DUF177 family)